MGEFRMPALGAGMDVGRILEWYVEPGDSVTRGSIIALVQTDKANIDVEVFEDGVVEELLVEPGTKVPVGTPLARIGAPADTAGGKAPPEETTEEATEETAAATPRRISTPEPEPAPERAPEGPPVVSPLVRRQAKEARVDLTRVEGTGAGGIITRADVAAAAATAAAAVTSTAAPAGPAEAPPPTDVRSSPYARRLAADRGLEQTALAGTGPDGAIIARDVPEAPEAPGPEVAPKAAAARSEESRPADGEEDRGLVMRQAIARAMARSNREIPHYYLGETVDVEQSMRWLAEHNAERPPTARLLPAVLVLKATAVALVAHPEFNGYWVDDAFEPGEGIHLGVAINLRQGGLLAPAIRDADQRSLDELMDALRDLVQRTRAGGLRGSELTDPTITVSNLGDTGVQTIQGVITPPQVALVGAGRITERPWAVDGMLAVRRTIDISLAGDHRASDGHRGGRFLGAIAANLARPEKL